MQGTRVCIRCIVGCLPYWRQHAFPLLTACHAVHGFRAPVLPTCLTTFNLAGGCFLQLQTFQGAYRDCRRLLPEIANTLGCINILPEAASCNCKQGATRPYNSTLRFAQLLSASEDSDLIDNVVLLVFRLSGNSLTCLLVAPVFMKPRKLLCIVHSCDMLLKCTASAGQPQCVQYCMYMKCNLLAQVYNIRL